MLTNDDRSEPTETSKSSQYIGYNTVLPTRHTHTHMLRKYRALSYTLYNCYDMLSYVYATINSIFVYVHVGEHHTCKLLIRFYPYGNTRVCRLKPQYLCQDKRKSRSGRYVSSRSLRLCCMLFPR